MKHEAGWATFADVPVEREPEITPREESAGFVRERGDVLKRWVVWDIVGFPGRCSLPNAYLNLCQSLDRFCDEVRGEWIVDPKWVKETKLAYMEYLSDDFTTIDLLRDVLEERAHEFVEGCVSDIDPEGTPFRKEYLFLKDRPTTNPSTFIQTGKEI